MNNPLVSVCLITYNQENYIQKAIKSIFDQEVGFPIEVIISNDCSSDNTHQKIEEILKDATNGLVVRYYNHKDNLGMMRNFSFAINECKGKYIAYFEGDDYWDYPKKLQTQVDFLEQNPDFEICWFGHIGDGNLHLNILKPADLSKDEFFAKCQVVNKYVFDIVKKYDGSISAEHGVGMTKKPYL